jgi:hypothetical protein
MGMLQLLTVCIAIVLQFLEPPSAHAASLYECKQTLLQCKIACNADVRALQGQRMSPEATQANNQCHAGCLRANQSCQKSADAIAPESSPRSDVQKDNEAYALGATKCGLARNQCNATCSSPNCLRDCTGTHEACLRAVHQTTSSAEPVSTQDVYAQCQRQKGDCKLQCAQASRLLPRTQENIQVNVRCSTDCDQQGQQCITQGTAKLRAAEPAATPVPVTIGPTQDRSVAGCLQLSNDCVRNSCSRLQGAENLACVRECKGLRESCRRGQ